MSPSRPSRPRRAAGATSPAARTLLWVLLLAIVAGGIYAGVHDHARLFRAWTALTSPASNASAPGAGATNQAVENAPPAPPCWTPDASLSGRELDLSRKARFETIEQLLRPGVHAALAYSVPGRLVSYRIARDRSYLLVLSSLVDPKRTIQARIPDSRCVANAEDAALFAELREDISLHFGPASTHAIVLASPPEVIVTGLVPASGPLELAPVVNVQVQ